MDLFGNGVRSLRREVGALRQELATLAAQVEQARADARTAKQEVSEVAERAYRHLKRAESRARRELEPSAGNGDGGPGTVPAPATAPALVRKLPWGGRGRRLARALGLRPSQIAQDRVLTESEGPDTAADEAQA